MISSYVSVEEMNAIDIYIYIYEINHFLINYMQYKCKPRFISVWLVLKTACIVFFFFSFFILSFLLNFQNI